MQHFTHYAPGVDALLMLALGEDIGTGDVTTQACVAPDAWIDARLLAREGLVLAGLPYFARAFALLDPRVTVKPTAAEGAEVAANTVVATVSGPAQSVLTGERTALNLLQRLSGTATLTRRFVEAIAGLPARIVDTRKTTPGMRFLEKYAVRVGGAANHRMTLDSGVLIKDNHIVAAGGLTAAVARARANVPHLLKVEVEVTTMALLEEALAVHADVIMLDNMSTAMMREAVARVRAVAPRTLVEASGGLSLGRVREVAETGVDLLSIGALTHSARGVDLSLEF
jgi:nicotinate-nucleotide pyrophosphorylase (carboxylating)